MTSRPRTSGSTLTSSSGTFQTPQWTWSCAHDWRALPAVYWALAAVQLARFRTAYSGRASSGIRDGRFEQRGELAPRRLAPRRDVVGRKHPLRLLVAPQDLPRHRHAVHLVGAVVDPGRPRVPVHLFERKVRRVAERPVDLDRTVDHVVQHLRTEELDHR